MLKILPEDKWWILVNFACLILIINAAVCNWVTIIVAEPIDSFKGLGQLFPDLLIIDALVLFSISLFGLFKELSLIGVIIFIGSIVNMVLVRFAYPIFLYHK